MWNNRAKLNAAVEPFAGAQEFLWVDGFALHACLVMKVWARRTSSRADLADHLSGFDRLSHPYFDRRQMAVSGRQTVAVIDVDRPPITAAPACGCHRAIGRRAHLLADLAVDVDARMHC